MGGLTKIGCIVGWYNFKELNPIFVLSFSPFSKMTHDSSYQMGGPLNGEGAKIFKGKVDKIIVYIWVSIPFLAAPPPIYIGFSWPHPKKWIFHPHNIKFFHP